MDWVSVAVAVALALLGVVADSKKKKSGPNRPKIKEKRQPEPTLNAKGRQGRAQARTILLRNPPRKKEFLWTNFAVGLSRQQTMPTN